MNARGWRVGSLREFYPKNRGVLGQNINAGYIVNVRLRDPSDKKMFLVGTDLLGTLLHE